MYNIKDVAKALLSKSEMSHKKLQKLAYIYILTIKKY